MSAMPRIALKVNSTSCVEKRGAEGVRVAVAGDSIFMSRIIPYGGQERQTRRTAQERRQAAQERETRRPCRETDARHGRATGGARRQGGYAIETDRRRADGCPGATARQSKPTGGAPHRRQGENRLVFYTRFCCVVNLTRSAQARQDATIMRFEIYPPSKCGIKKFPNCA